MSLNMVMRHGIEELPYPKLCERVWGFMTNASDIHRPLWDADTAHVANLILDYDDEVLACHVLDVLAAIEAAKVRHMQSEKPV
jgi:hypothetical protein